MWCRLVTGEMAKEAQTVGWRQAGSGAGGPDEAQIDAPRKLYTEPRPALGEAGTDSEAAALRAAEKLATDAYQRGLQEGEAAAARRLTAPVDAKLDQLGRSIEQLAMHRAKIQREAEPELVRLALA